MIKKLLIILTAVLTAAAGTEAEDMAINKENFRRVELATGIVRDSLPVVIGEGDIEADRFGVEVFRGAGDTPTDLTGMDCTGYFIRQTGDTVVITGTVDGNRAWVDLPQACYAYEGQFSLAIKLVGGGVTGTMRIVDGVVRRTTTDTTVDPGTLVPSIEDLIQAIEDASDEIEAVVASIPADYSALWGNFAPAFSTGNSYSTGDVVTYDGAVYRFVRNHTGAWSTDDVEAVSAGSEISSTAEQLRQLNASEGYYLYNGGVEVRADESNNYPSFVRNGNTFTLNGAFGNSNNYYYSLSSVHASRASAKSTFRSWAKLVGLKDGHKYKATLTLVSGSYTLAEGGSFDADLIDADGNDAAVTTVNSKSIFKWNGESGSLAFHSTGGNSFSNAVFSYTLKDITDGDLSDIGAITGQLEKDIYYVPDFTNSGYNVSGPIIEPDTKRIGPADFVFCKKNDVIRVRHSTGMQHVWRIWEGTLLNNTRLSLGGTWGTSDEEIVCPVDGFFGIKYADAEDDTQRVRVEDFDGGVSVVSHAFLTDIQKFIAPSTKDLAYSWWVNNRVMDSYGTLYFGYISKDNKCGVGCRYPDGTIRRQDIFMSEECDDHNAPSVIILKIDGLEYVCVIGSTGHNTDNKINCYVATEPNSITCVFENRSHAITEPEGYKIQCSYSQAYFDGNRGKIYDFFRIKQIETATGTYHMIWMCAVSADYGETWSVYRVFKLGASGTLYYMWSADVNNNNYMKRIVLQVNSTNQAVKSLRTGIVDCDGLNIYSGSGYETDNLNKPMTLMEDGELAYDPNVTIADYDDFTEVVPAGSGEYYRYRILDVYPGTRNELHFLYAKSVENVQDHHDITDWILYKYTNTDFRNHPESGVITEIAHLGLPFFVGSAYVTGACFVNGNSEIVYSKNLSNNKDGTHDLRLAKLTGTTVESDSLIKKSSMLIARPVRFDTGSIMYLYGSYNEGSGTAYLTWHFGIGFVDSHLP